MYILSHWYAIKDSEVNWTSFFYKYYYDTVIITNWYFLVFNWHGIFVYNFNKCYASNKACLKIFTKNPINKKQNNTISINENNK